MHGIYFILVGFMAMIATAIAVATSHSNPARPGEAVFTADCTKCHTGGLGGFISNVPDIDDPEDWEALTPKGLDALTTNTITGIGDMAARGACAGCTDEEIRAAVEFILENVQ
jgi:cytochrome c5